MQQTASASALLRLQRRQRSHAKAGIVHFGPGAFFRAFNAVYTDETMKRDHSDWGIRAVSLRSPNIRNTLAPQDYAYTSISMQPKGMQCKVIEVINDILVAPENPEAVLVALADPAIHIVSFTITEKGYCHNPATGELQADHPDIQHDLEHPESPISAIGFLVSALAHRKEAGKRPFTILSCDNLPNNGALIKHVVLDFAHRRDADLAQWIEAEARFPATMVDRITPATTAANISDLAEAAGYQDLGCVVHEPFRQWVIEDDFVDDKRPDWAVAGAQFVRDVAAFETMKLRCLNGTHSTLAYLGYLAGHETIANAVVDPIFAALIDNIWQHEIIPTVPQPEGEDIVAYCASLKARYLNPSIRHLTWQIAMDGSQKLPQRLLGTISDNLAAGREIPLLALAVAGWMRYVSGIDEKGNPIDVRDPLAKILRDASDSADASSDKVAALLSIEAVFEPKLAADRRFRDSVIAAYDSLATHGARATIEQAIQGA